MSDSDKHEKILTRLANHGLHIPVLAQYSRLDTTQAAYTLMTATPTGRE